MALPTNTQIQFIFDNVYSSQNHKKKEKKKEKDFKFLKNFMGLSQDTYLLWCPNILFIFKPYKY